MTQANKHFRDEGRAFLEKVLPAEMRFTARRLEMMGEASARNWQALLAGRGWSVPHWPVQYGGTDWTADQHQIFTVECVATGTPLASDFGNNKIGPILNARGAEEQMRVHFQPYPRRTRLGTASFI